MCNLTLINILIVLAAVYGVAVSAAEPVLSDPTRPAEYTGKTQNVDYTEKKISDYKVSQIYISANTRMAVINHQQVKQGDKLGHAEVLAILPDRVQLLINGKIKNVRIIPAFKQYND